MYALQAAIVIRAAEELAELKERAAAESEVAAEAAREVLGLEQALEDTQRTNIDFSRSLKCVRMSASMLPTLLVTDAASYISSLVSRCLQFLDLHQEPRHTLPFQ